MNLFDNGTSRVSPSQLVEFVQLVEKMRTSQKDYFKSRSKFDLNEAKKLKKEVDSKIKEIGTNGVWE